MRTLGVDFGTRRVGLAISDPFGMIATPLEILEVRGRKDAVSQILERVEAHEVVRIVVGLPLSMDGRDSEVTRAARRFADALTAAVSVPVELWDERLTTAEVERAMLADDVSRARRKKNRDKLAAQVMLQSFLEASGDLPDMDPMDGFDA